MTSTSLFDGYLSNSDRVQGRQALSPRRTESFLPSHNVDESASSSQSPAQAMSLGSRLRLSSEGEQHPQFSRSPRELHAMDEEEEMRLVDDDNNTIAIELDDRTASAMPTPTPSTVNLGDPPPKQSSSLSHSASGSQRQPRKPSALPPPNIRFRHIPRLPNHHADKLAPSTVPYWSRAPVYGALPVRCMRAHTVTLIDNIAWQIGGCDHQSCSREVLTFDIETMQWARPEIVGDIPPPCRAHSATQVDRRIFIFGGGEGPTYYNHVYVLDTVMRRWHKVKVLPNAPEPIPRRAHATWYYQGKIYLFGGGNGARALNDLWTFDVGIGASHENLRWEQIEVQGITPGPRGYHTANLINNSVVVIGGSDGSACFDDVWVLNLERMTWHDVKLEVPTKRLSHTSTQVGSYLFVMGGHDGSKYNHELLLFNLVTLQWETKETRGRYPSSRGYHATILADSRLFVIGGFDGHTVFDDVFILDLAAAAYLPQVKSFDLMLN